MLTIACEIIWRARAGSTAANYHKLPFAAHSLSVEAVGSAAVSNDSRLCTSSGGDPFGGTSAFAVLDARAAGESPGLGARPKMTLRESVLDFFQVCLAMFAGFLFALDSAVGAV